MEKSKKGRESKQQAIGKAENNFCTSNARKKLDTAISKSDIESTTEILNAVKCAGSTTIRELLVSPDEFVKTTLHEAVKVGNIVIVKKLLCSLEDYKDTLTALLLFPDRSEETALHYAAKMTYIEDVPQELLNFAQRAGGDTLTKLLLSPNVLGKTALHYAAEMKSDNDDMVEKLLDFAKQAGGNTLKALLLSRDSSDETALHIAVAAGNEVIAQTLLDNTRAIEDDQSTLIKLVLSIDRLGETVLDRAVSVGREGIVKLLLNNTRAIEDDQSTLIKLLLSSDGLRETALLKAVTVKHEGIVETLLDDARAIEDDQSTLTKLLLSSDNSGENALHKAVKVRNSGIVQKLFCSVENNKDALTALLLSYNHANRTAIDYAVIIGDIGILKEILLTAEKVKDGNVVLTNLLLSTDIFGDTALDNAISIANSDTAKMLLITAAYLGKNTLESLIECSNILSQGSVVADVTEKDNINKFLSLLKDARKNKYFETHTLKTLLSVEEDRSLHLTRGEDSTHNELDNVIDQDSSDNPANKENENVDVITGKKAIENQTTYLENVKEQEYFNQTNDIPSTSSVDRNLESMSINYNTNYTAANSSSTRIIGEDINNISTQETGLSITNANTMLLGAVALKTLGFNVSLGNNHTLLKSEQEIKVENLTSDILHALQVNKDLFGDDVSKEESPDLLYSNNSSINLHGDIQENEHQ